MITRKTFLQHMATVAAMSVTGFGFSRFKSSVESSFSVFDLHCHPGNFFMKGIPIYPGDDGVAKTVADMKDGNLCGAFFSMVMDMPILKRTETGISPARSFDKGEAWKEYKRQLEIANSIFLFIEANRSTQLRDLSIFGNNGKIAAFLSCEGGDFINSANQLDEVFADGVRSIQLVHYAPNPLGDLQTHEPQHNGLSALGKDVVKKMNDLGMVIDVAHASYKTVQDVADITQAPIILSHSILKMEPNRPIAARAISVDHAKLIARTGGVIGAWPSGFSKNFDEFVDNTLRLADVVGIDHVGLGTDMDSNFKPVLDNYNQIPKWMEALHAKGLSDDEVKKIAGGNAKRVLQTVLKS